MKTEYYVKTVREIRELEKSIQDAKKGINQRLCDLYDNGMSVRDIVFSTNYSETTLYNIIQPRKRGKK